MSRSKKDQRGGHKRGSLVDCLMVDRVSASGKLLGCHDGPSGPWWRRSTHKVIRRALRKDLNIRLKESY